jgi:tol-pal system protein YbgF
MPLARLTRILPILGFTTALIGSVTGAVAQQQWQTAQARAEPAQRAVQGGAQKSGRAPAPAAKAPGGESATADAAPAGGDAHLRQRVEQLEEQLVDLQVVIGTLESLAKSHGGSASPGAFRSAASTNSYSSSEAGRIDGLETQIRALTAQLEQLAEQVRALDGRRAPQATAAVPFSSRESVADPRATRPETGTPPQTMPSGTSQVTAFGSTTVNPGESDPSGRMLNEEWPSQGASRLAAIAPPSDDGGNPKQAYETAYGYLLQQNYGAAENAFDEFLKRYPNDPLAGNAQYWLGEAHFVRGQYKAAANAFLKGYQTYAKSAKAPESLLKLAMSLDRLGQKDAACSSYTELNGRFPNAPAHVKTRAQGERQRLGC